MSPSPTPSQDAPTLTRSADATARWHRAVSIAHTIPTPPSRPDGTWTSGWDKLASSLLVLALTGTGLVLAYGRRTATGSMDASTTWTRVGLQAGLTVTGLVLLIAGVVVSIRSGQWRARTTGPLTVLDRRQRQSLMRQLRGSGPVQDDEQVLEVLRAVAVGQLRPWGAVLAMCGMVVNIAGQAVGVSRLAGMAGMSVLWLICLVLFAITSLVLLRDQRAAERFLSGHPSAAPSNGSAARTGDT